MPGQAIIIKPGETIDTATRVDLDDTPDLDFLQDAVKGFIETVPGFDKLVEQNGDHCVVFCNEEGKLKGMAPNVEAQRLWELAVGRRITDDLLVGPVVIITGDDDFMGTL